MDGESDCLWALDKVLWTVIFARCVTPTYKQTWQVSMWSPKNLRVLNLAYRLIRGPTTPLPFFFFGGREHSRLKGLTVGKALGCPSG